MVELQEAVDSPNFLLLYDIGNAVTHGKEAEEFFRGIRGRFSYVHVKDATKPVKAGEEATPVYCGDGDARVESILRRIIVEDGYDGVIAIEPHVASMVHAGESADKSPEEMYASYVAYGKRLEKILAEVAGRPG
jgi:sugar phosphate isomerase/epimerase